MTNTQIPSYSGVTINISNPTVNTNPFQQNCIPAPIANIESSPAQITPINQQEPIQTVNAAPQAYPPQYYLNNYNYQNSKEAVSEPIKQNDTTSIQTGTTPSNEQDMTSSAKIINELDERAAKQKELEETGKQTRIVTLTDEYIKSLENYLNNQNTEIRVMAAKEILTRLDEDKTRHDDAALNALLNKMLQDPQKLVRIAALSAFSSGLASGNDYTVQLLNNIQQNPDSEKEDVVEAANILLKFSADTEIKYTPKQEEQKEAQ